MNFKTFICSMIINALTVSCVNMNMLSHDSKFKGYQELIDQNDQRPSEIRVGDKFSISVWKHENLSIGSIYGIYNSNQVFGKWQVVKSDSTIIFPKLGAVKLVGLTVEEAEDLISNLYAIIIVDPLVTIQIHSHTVEVLGQVDRPGNITLFHHKHTVLEALSATGGYTDYAHLSQAKIIRNGIGYQLDLTKITPQELASLYLKPGDLLFIPMKDSKKVDQKSSILLAGASVITTLLLIIKK